jgi:hypothetical protein
MFDTVHRNLRETGTVMAHTLTSPHHTNRNVLKMYWTIKKMLQRAEFTFFLSFIANKEIN